LELLKSTNSVSVPDVIGTGTAEGDSFLILQAVIAGRRTGNYSEALGRNLAKLHRNSSYQFGLDHNNYIGSLSQSNKSFESGVDFFINERIRPMVASARDKKYFSNQELESFNQLYKKLPSLLPAEPPALLHGDLWNGNVITGPDGHAWLIDPAIYYGHRETDLAMAQLFGGFYDDFYDAYNEAFPLTPGWKKRVQLFQLYPLLVHLNLFGRGYLNGINQILVQLIR
jgi:fructosamine-3-kinase